MLQKILPILLLIALSAHQLQAQQKNEPQKKIKTGFEKLRQPGAELPPLKIVTGKMRTFTNKDFRTKHHLFLVMFNPTCGHCIKMTKLICKNAELFEKSKVVFMAPASMMSYLNGFYKATKVYDHPEFIIGVDSAYAVEKLYSYGTLPQINIYDRHEHLLKTFKGDTPLDSLKQYLP